MTTRWARVARGWVAAVVAIAIAGASHVLAGGAAPSAFGLAVALVIAGTVCTLFTARAMSLWRLVLGVGVSQVLFHTIFSGLGSPTVASHNHGVAGHGMAELLGSAANAHSTMWAAHALAALTTIVTLRYGEAAFWGLGTTARLLFVRILAAPVVVGLEFSRPSVPAERVFVPVALTTILSTMRHRGPPLVAHAA